jgi:diguanylate cyclase (GGDEF)-like protein
MPRPDRPPRLARFVRRHWAALLAPPYLLSLIILRQRYPEGPAFATAAVGFLLFLFLLVRNLLAWRAEARFPDGEAILVWGGVSALEIHAFVPFVAQSRVVPAALFFLLGYRLPVPVAVPAAIACTVWFTAIVHGRAPAAPEAGATGILAAAAIAAGTILRRRKGRSAEGRNPVREAIERDRSIVLPWEEAHGARGGGETKATEETALVRREVELREGIVRSLEAVLPLTGASLAAYLTSSHTPGRTGLEGVVVRRSGKETEEISVPETFLPVREAHVFRRPFLEEGEPAARHSPWGREDGVRPTGVASVPVLREGATEGILLVVREEEGRWATPVIPLLELVAYFIGRDIERARSLYRGERHYLRGDWYNQMVRRMAQMQPPGSGNGEADLSNRRERVYADAAKQVRLQTGASRVLIVASADSGRKGRLVREESALGGREEEDPVPLGDSYLGWAIRTGSQRLFSEPHGSPRSQDVLPARWQAPGERSYVVLPTGARDGVAVAVVCTHPEERKFQREHADIVRGIAEVMQLGLSHVEYLETLTRRATTDGLTGLLNRKAFLSRLEEELDRLDGRHPCAVVMLDIDHFKRVNDTYGHPFGDEVLRRVAGVLGKAVRKGDAAGRYGGEEFVLYLHMTGPEKASEVAERFRRMIRQARLPHEAREVAVTASLGIACSPAHGRKADELVRKADEALYLSKNRGRDRVTMYPG